MVKRHGCRWGPDYRARADEAREIIERSTPRGDVEIGVAGALVFFLLRRGAPANYFHRARRSKGSEAERRTRAIR